VELDVLSDVISVVRTGKPMAALVTWRAPWGQRFASESGSAGFHVILQGSCWLRVRGAEPVHVSAGDVIFLPHAGEHVLADSPTTPPGPDRCRPDDPMFEARVVRETAPASDGAVTVLLGGAYYLEPSRAHPLLRDLPPIVHLPARLGHQPQLRAAIDLLSAELERPRIGTYAIIPSLLDTLLLYVLRAWFDDQPADASGGWAAALRDPGVTAALHAIHREPSRPWTVASLAREAGLSRAPFARRFAALVGQPPLTYLTWWRLSTAARLLVDSDAPLGTIATAVGYASEFAFANAFKRHHGLAPGRYRRMEAARPNSLKTAGSENA
jgi:AraC-like DNA-binding protein